MINVVQEAFDSFHEKIKLSKTQREDAVTKHTNVCEVVHKYLYDKSLDANNRLLFGSYATSTNVTPMPEDQDVDVIVKITQDHYDKYDGRKGNGQSDLLRDIRNALLDSRYKNSENVKAWGKVIHVKTADGTHNVEILPALELEDRTFLIPDTADGGSWLEFDPRSQMDEFKRIQKDTDGVARNIIRGLKLWRNNTSGINYSSYEIMQDVIEFFDYYYSGDTDDKDYADIYYEFFDWKLENMDEEDTDYTKFKTARSRALRAIEAVDADNYDEASDKWKQIFSDIFPKIKKKQKKDKSESIKNPEKPWLSE